MAPAHSWKALINRRISSASGVRPVASTSLSSPTALAVSVERPAAQDGVCGTWAMTD